MAVNVRSIITGSALKAGVLYAMWAAPCTYMPLKYLWATTLVKTWVKMRLTICKVLGVFACIIFSPKAFVAKGYSHGGEGMPISIVFEYASLLKPFINDHLAVSQFGVVHVVGVSHVVSFLASNIMGIWASALSHSGKAVQVFWVSQTVSFFTRCYTTAVFTSAVSCYGRWAMDYGQFARFNCPIFPIFGQRLQRFGDSWFGWPVLRRTKPSAESKRLIA